MAKRREFTGSAPGECWLPVVGFEGRYVVSDQGRIVALSRREHRARIILSGTPDHAGYLGISLVDTGRRARRRIHTVVAEAFLGPRPEGLDVRHLDGDPTNNAAVNLRYGTKFENQADSRRHGTNHNSNKTHCHAGHPFDEENTRIRAGGRGRICRACKRIRARQAMGGNANAAN